MRHLVIEWTAPNGLFGAEMHHGTDVEAETKQLQRDGCTFTVEPYLQFGEVCRELGMQCQYGVRYVDPNFSTDAARAKGNYYEYLGEGLRFYGKPANYHDLYIHEEDAPKFVERLAEMRRAEREWP